jgi:glycosyltransferase involved in cell wall biosynthesis
LEGTEVKKVSIILPFFGETHLIKNCLENLKSQTLPTQFWDCWIVDNGPPRSAAGREDLLQFISFFPNAYYLQEPKLGPYAARNTGARASDGKFLAFTDADCSASSNWLEEGLNYLNHSEESVWAGHIDLKFSNSKKKNIFELYDYFFTPLSQKDFVNQGYGATANLWVKRSVFFQVGPFREDLFDGGDVEWCFRASSG